MVCHHGDRGVSFYGNSGLGPRLPLSKFRLLAPEDTCTHSLETHNKKQVCMCHSTVITHIEKPIQGHTMEYLDLMTLRDLHNTINPVITHLTLIYVCVHVGLNEA